MQGEKSLGLATSSIPFAVTLEPYAAIALMLGIGAISNTANTFPSVLIAVPGSAGWRIEHEDSAFTYLGGVKNRRRRLLGDF